MKSKHSLYDLKLLPFSAQGSLSSITTTRDVPYEQRNDDLYLSLTKSNGGNLTRSGLARISLLHDGKEVPYEYTATFTTLRLESGFGFVEFCMEKSLLHFRGQGITLRFACRMDQHEGGCSREDGSFEAGFALMGKFLFVPLSGRFVYDAAYNWRLFKPDDMTFDFCPQDGAFSGVVHSYISNELRLEHYTPFEEVVRANEAALEEWAKKYPKVAPEFEQTARVAVYTIWSHVMEPDGLLKDRVVYMSRNHLVDAFGWQQSYQAMAAWRDIQTAWQLLHNMFDYQLPAGQLPDWINSMSAMYLCTKPPFQGFAATWILDHADLSSLTREQCQWLYEPLGKWTNWWLDYRDSDHDGVPQYNHGDESGWDDASIFAKGVPLESADLCAYLCLQTEVLARLAKRIGLHSQAKMWQEKSNFLFGSMMAFWDGERFVPMLSTTHEKVYSDSIAVFHPIIMGKRLPQNVIQSIARTLEKDYVTDFGIASEKLGSPLSAYTNCFLRGNLVSPVQLMMATGLYEAGEKELAQKIARRFCRKVVRDGFALCHYPFDREDLVLESPDFNLAFGSDILLATSWTAAIFLFLAGDILEGK